MTHDRDDQPTEQDGQVSELAVAGGETGEHPHKP